VTPAVRSGPGAAGRPEGKRHAGPDPRKALFGPVWVVVA